MRHPSSLSDERLFTLSAALLIVLLSGCGNTEAPDTWTCGPSNCVGCCDASGQCVRGADAVACGTGGQACAACAPGESCDPADGVCKTTVACNPETDAELCAAKAVACGQIQTTDRCGQPRLVASCGSCPDSERCNGEGLCTCVPESNAELCAANLKTCGTLTAIDRCGNSRTIVSCGSCTSPEACNSAGQCECPGESDAQVCARKGRSCGSLTTTDLCGRPRTVANCGTCAGINTCTDGVCSCPGETNPAFCARLGAECGTLSGTDLCGNTRNVSSCGACLAPDTCGGGGVSNTCGCTPESDAQFCARLGKDCGPVTGADNCGASRTVECGSCALPETCGGGGVTNVCGCTSESDAAFCAGLGATCGTASGTDTCGRQRSVSCGTCTAPETCGGGGTPNVCGCTAQTDAELCAGANNVCGAMTVTDRCGASRSIASCGSCPSATRCKTSQTNRTCVSFTCPANQLACGNACAPCPTDGVTSTACGANDACVATSCAQDHALVDGACVPVTCPDGERSCGGVCRTCPTANVRTTTCSGPVCIAASCEDGSALAGGACTPMSCSSGQLYCSTACARCPETGATTYACSGSSCVAQTCASGYSLSQGRCIDSDWAIEVIESSADGLYYDEQPRSAAITLDPSGNVHVAYVDPPNIVVARRTTSGWNKTSVALGQPGLTAVTALAVDAAGNAHVVYYTFKLINTHTSTYAYRYARISPAGGTSLTTNIGDVIYYNGGNLQEEDGVALAVDSAGDAHLAFNWYQSGNNRLRYMRTYQGAWLAPIDAAVVTMSYPAIAVDAADVVHVAGVNGQGLNYTRGVYSVFATPVTVTLSGASIRETQIVASGAGVSIWARGGRNYYRSDVTGSSLSAPQVWGNLTGTPNYVSGAANATRFTMLEQSSSGSPPTAHSGSTSGPTLTEITNLRMVNLEHAAVLDANGTFHGLSWSGDELSYVRGH
ncbi:MAG: hypothetical protein WBV82_06320 [Myxococcaceae bacterium]